MCSYGGKMCSYGGKWQVKPHHPWHAEQTTTTEAAILIVASLSALSV
jgi:hypothetical protein